MLNAAGWLLVGAALFGPKPEAAAAEVFPSRPVRLIVPSGAGGITDILARVIAVRLPESLGQQVVVDNRPGASGVVGSDIVAKATPDGHTLLMVFPSHPGQLNHASTGSGSMGNLGAVLLRSMARIEFTLVAYKGAPQALNALLSGEVQFYLLGSAGTAVSHIKTGRIRALGVGASKRVAVLPDVPTIAETLPGYEARGWNGVLAPARTPQHVIDRLHREIVKIVRSPEFNEILYPKGQRQSATRRRSSTP